MTNTPDKATLLAIAEAADIVAEQNAREGDGANQEGAGRIAQIHWITGRAWGTFAAALRAKADGTSNNNDGLGSAAHRVYGD